MSPASNKEVPPELVALTTAAIHGLTSREPSASCDPIVRPDKAGAIGEIAADIALGAYNRLLTGLDKAK